MQQNKFKIVIPSYNNEKWIEPNLASIIHQNYTNFEVLYIDDASTDDTYEIVQHVVHDLPNWKVIRNEKNRLYEITNDGGDDYGPNGTSQIKGFITTGRYDFNRSGLTNKFVRKKLTGGEMWMSNIPGEVTSQVEYRSDSNPCWSELKVPTTFGCNPCSPTLIDDCTPRRGGYQ